jgi:hypothetical protein
MKTFKEYLKEEMIPMYHRTNPEAAARLQSGEKIRPGGLSFFRDPNMAASYEGELSAGTVHPGAPTVTGKTPSSNAVPDLEWHPDRYTGMFKDIASKMESDPTYRPPSLQTTSHNPSTGQPKWQMTLPGAVAVTDSTGAKRIEPGWKPAFQTDNFGRTIPYIEPHPSSVTKKVNLDPNAVERFGRYQRFPSSTTQWGGQASVDSLSGFPEQQQLHALTNKAGIRQMNSDFEKSLESASQIEDPQLRSQAMTKTLGPHGRQGFRTLSSANVQIDKPQILPPATKSGLGSKVVRGVMRGLGAVGSILDPAASIVTGAVDAVAGAAGVGSVAPGAALFINQKAGESYEDIANLNSTPEQRKAESDARLAKMDMELAKQQKEREERDSAPFGDDEQDPRVLSVTPARARNNLLSNGSQQWKPVVNR